MKDRIIDILEKYGKVFVLFCIGVAILGIVLSYVFPNEIPYEIEVNNVEQEDFNLTLTPGAVVTYRCNTGTKPMAGIQVWISKEGQEFWDGRIIYEVYNKDESVLYGVAEQSLAELFDIQFVYLPFKGMKECNGDLVIKFSYTGSENVYPVLKANKVELEDASTSVDGNIIEGNLKSSYIYMNYTHPLVFDLKIILVIFITVFFTFESKKKQKVKEV